MDLIFMLFIYHVDSSGMLCFIAAILFRWQNICYNGILSTLSFVFHFFLGMFLSLWRPYDTDGWLMHFIVLFIFYYFTETFWE